MERWGDGAIRTRERLSSPSRSLLVVQSLDALVDHHIDTEGRTSIDEALGEVPQHGVGDLA